MASLILVDVTKEFGDIVAVDNLNLFIPHGEFFVVVGPSGCGKTTLLKLIAGLIKPDRGSIYIDGELVNDLPPPKRGVNMVFQSYALFPHMKVFDEKKYSNLSFALKLRRYIAPTIRTIVEGVSDQVGIERILYPRKPGELSAGQQQKVAVGRSILIPPRILLMDEPLSNLDPQSRLKVIDELRRLHRELETTTVYVTHNLAEAMALADRMAVMNRGCIEQVDNPENIYNNPANEFVADFVKYFDFSYQMAKRRMEELAS
ncbi:MAG: ABC transporter ATP-binding protein [Candidatus Bathyarchaeia archaeon]